MCLKPPSILHHFPSLESDPLQTVSRYSASFPLVDKAIDVTLALFSGEGSGQGRFMQAMNKVWNDYYQGITFESMVSEDEREKVRRFGSVEAADEAAQASHAQVPAAERARRSVGKSPSCRTFRNRQRKRPASPRKLEAGRRKSLCVLCAMSLVCPKKISARSVLYTF